MNSWIDYLSQLIHEFYWEICIGILFILLGATYFFGRTKINEWRYKRKIQPKFEKVINVYEKEVLPEFVENKPKIKVLGEKEQVPADLPFGYIFIPKGEEELIWNTLITYIPLSSSMQSIRILFDEKLRKAMFDLLSYQLGLKLNMGDLAVTFRDNALQKYPKDYEAMEKLFNDGKLTTVILFEASERFRRTKSHISSSDVKEFSILVRKIAETDARVVRVGSSPVDIEKIIETGRGVVLLARGIYIDNAILISKRLQEKGYEEISKEDLGLPNPETGTWHFEYPAPQEVSFMRIWLRKKHTEKSRKK